MKTDLGSYSSLCALWQGEDLRIKAKYAEIHFWCVIPCHIQSSRIPLQQYVQVMAFWGTPFTTAAKSTVFMENQMPYTNRLSEKDLKGVSLQAR